MADTGGTYSFLDVVASIAGPGLSARLGSDAGAAQEGITVAMAGDKNTVTPGADGSYMHSLHASRVGMVTVRLLKTSPLNRVLMNGYNQQTNGSSANHGKNTIVVSNLQTGDVITATGCAYKKVPDLTYAVEGGMNEWVFDAGSVVQQLGSGAPALNGFGN